MPGSRKVTAGCIDILRAEHRAQQFECQITTWATNLPISPMPVRSSYPLHDCRHLLFHTNSGNKKSKSSMRSCSSHARSQVLPLDPVSSLPTMKSLGGRRRRTRRVRNTSPSYVACCGDASSTRQLWSGSWGCLRRRESQSSRMMIRKEAQSIRSTTSKGRNCRTAWKEQDLDHERDEVDCLVRRRHLQEREKGQYHCRRAPLVRRSAFHKTRRILGHSDGGCQGHNLRIPIHAAYQDLTEGE